MGIVIGKIIGNTCRRCEGLLSYDKASVSFNGGVLCITCGFVDYSLFKLDKDTGSSEGLFYIVPYQGRFAGLQDTTIKVRIARASMTKFQATCPFCTSSTGWIDETEGTRKNDVRRYQCSELHRFRVYVWTDTDDLVLGWD